MSTNLRLLLIFSPQFWFVLSLFIITTGSVIIKYYKTPVIKACLMITALLTDQSYLLIRTRLNSHRIILASWFFFTLVTSTLFKSKLIILMATVEKKPALDTLDDIIASKLPIYSMIDLRPYYDSPNEPRKLDFASIRQCPGFTQCQMLTSINQNSISIGGRSILEEYFIPRHFIKNGVLTVHISKEVIYAFHFHLLFRKGHPVYKQCSKNIRTLRVNGWFAKIMRDMRHQLYLQTYKVRRIKSKIVSLGDIMYIFKIWLLGIIAALGVFIFELIFISIRPQ